MDEKIGFSWKNAAVQRRRVRYCEVSEMQCEVSNGADGGLGTNVVFIQCEMT